MQTSPRAASNFLAFCRGDTPVPGGPPGARFTYVNATFYRILDQVRCCTRRFCA